MQIHALHVSRQLSSLQPCSSLTGHLRLVAEYQNVLFQMRHCTADYSVHVLKGFVAPT